jgi:toxin-antitoxin system PIN domain toxin
MTVALLDVNALLALFDPRHVHHDAAHAWFRRRGDEPWATCAITENGLIRIASSPNYPSIAESAPQLIARLRLFCESERHRFWHADVSIRDLVRAGATLTSSQITDVYLLGLAVAHGGKLATFDRHIPVTTVYGGRDALEVIPH